MVAAVEHAGEVRAARPGRAPDWPLALFWGLVAVYSLVLLAFSLGTPITLAAINKDAWQHLAALQALIQNPLHPSNPFVASTESSRLFGPVHVAAALVARALGLSSLGAYGLVAALNLALLAVGQFLFGRAYVGARFGPLALFAAMTLGWWVPVIHTGFHSSRSLIEGAEYPATTGIALGLILWGWTIRLIERPRWSLGYPLLVALLVANHQLSAGIALVGAGCFGLLQPGTLEGRIRTALLGVAGLVLAAAWPYYNPYAVLLSVGSEPWGPSVDFYGFWMLSFALWPSVIGLFGLGRPTLAMLAIYTLAFLTGLLGVTVAHRFLMPITLVLHIGLARLLIRLWPTRWRLALVSGLTVCAAVQTLFLVELAGIVSTNWREHGDLLAHARALRLTGVTAADGLAAWPVTASGTKVVSTVLPEPLVHDLAQRRADDAAIFDPRTDPSRRLALLAKYRVKSLVTDRALERPGEAAALSNVAVPVARSGELVRWDVRPDVDRR